MDLSKIKQIVSKEGKVIIADNDDIMVVMLFDEYEKIKNKNLGLSSALLESAMPSTIEKPEIKEEIKEETRPEAQAEQEKPAPELTLDDLPF